MAPSLNPQLAREQLQLARAELQALAQRSADATQREWEHARSGEWHAYCAARRAGLDDPEIARLLGISARVLWERHGQHYPPPT
jgi:hypothetical protein